MKYRLWNNETKAWVKQKNGMVAEFKTYPNAVKGIAKRGLKHVSIKRVDFRGDLTSEQPDPNQAPPGTQRAFNELLTPKKPRKAYTSAKVQSDEFKIEPFIQQVRRNRDRGVHFRTFCETLYKLEIGKGFKVQKTPSNYRLAITVIQAIHGRQYTVRREGEGWRVGRVA